MATNANLLLVEDDANLRQSLAAILAQVGYGVRSAQDGFEALAQIRDNVPDLILSDLFMPGMSGFELLSVVRRRFPGIRVIAMSSAYPGGNIPTGIAADAFYEKATNIPSLLAIIAAVHQKQSEANARLNAATIPVWISRAGQSARAAYVILACPECLRSFSHELLESADLFHESKCIYCESLIHFALVQAASFDAPAPGPLTGVSR